MVSILGFQGGRAAHGPVVSPTTPGSRFRDVGFLLCTNRRLRAGCQVQSLKLGRRAMSFPFQCRSCGGSKGSLILDLGQQPLANNLLRPEDLAKPEPKFPLRLAVCRSCWLLQ